MDILASKQDKRFNWFLCSKRYEDPLSGVYIAEIQPGTKFYNDLVGTNYVLTDTAKLMILNCENEVKTISSHIKYMLIKFGYQGVACVTECDNPDGSIICSEALFNFIDGVLKIEGSNPGSCPIIRYAKANYKCIRSKIPDFPTPSEIDDVLSDGYSLTVVCKILYDDIMKYTNTLSH